MPTARVNVRVQPGARRSEVVGWRGDTLRLRVQAPALEGRANAAVVELLANVLDVSRSRVWIERGETSHEKVLGVEGLDEVEVRRRLGWPAS